MRYVIVGLTVLVSTVAPQVANAWTEGPSLWELQQQQREQREEGRQRLEENRQILEDLRRQGNEIGRGWTPRQEDQTPDYNINRYRRRGW